MAIIIGASIGGVVFVIVVGVLIYCLCCGNKNSSEQNFEDEIVKQVPPISDRKPLADPASISPNRLQEKDPADSLTVAGTPLTLADQRRENGTTDLTKQNKVNDVVEPNAVVLEFDQRAAPTAPAAGTAAVSAIGSFVGSNHNNTLADAAGKSTIAANAYASPSQVSSMHPANGSGVKTIQDTATG